MKRGYWLWGVGPLFILAAINPQYASIRASGQAAESAHRRGANGFEGWTISYPVVGGSSNEKYPMMLVIARDGHVLHRISGEPFVWKWIFWAGGREVAYEAAPLHFSLECILANSATGRRLASYDCFHGIPEKAPSWLSALEDSRRLPAAVQDQDRSFYFGRPVNDPEELSGVWEAPDGHGGVVGLHLMLDTTAPADAKTLVGTKQSWLDLQVGMYERSGDDIQFEGENGFSDSPRGGGVRYNGGRLILHYGGFDLDLKRITGDKWSGRFHRKGFDSEVTLVRPGSRDARKKMWLVGTWRLVQNPGENCLHIAETHQGKLIGWSDSLLTWGAARFGPNVTKPPYSLEHYGELAKVNTEGGQPSIELYAYTGICCSHLLTAVSAEGGAAMDANWDAGPNQAPHRAQWKKMPSDSCIASVP